MECYFEKKLSGLPKAEVLARIEEALKFLNMSEFCRGNIPVTQEIDDIWHYWILETREYAKLCSALSSGDFLHHCSNTYAECATGESVPTNSIEDDIEVLGTYVLNYGPFHSDRIKYWLLPAHLLEEHGMTVDELNSWLLNGTSAPMTGTQQSVHT